MRRNEQANPDYRKDRKLHSKMTLIFQQMPNYQQKPAKTPITNRLPRRLFKNLRTAFGLR
jgi:hypothetical protein